MFILDISVDGVAWDVVEVTRDRISLGRRAESDIQLLDPTVSGQHAVITITLGDVWIEDVGSTNGTFVNDELVRRQLLRDGDQIGIGQHRLTCQIPQSVEDDVMPLAASAPVVATDPAELDQAHVDALANLERTMRRMPQGDEMPSAHLKLLNGPHAGKNLKLDQPNFSLGAFRQRMAVVARKPTGYYLLPVVEFETANGYPHVNGEPVPEDGCPLMHRDRIDVGGVQMDFMFEIQ